MATTFLLSRTLARRLLTSEHHLIRCAVGSGLPTNAPFSTSSVLQSSAGKHWRTERVVAVGLMALIPAGIVYPNPIIDYTLATLIPLHNHWGFGSIIIDYVPKSLQALARLLLYVLSFGTFGGLVYLTYSDVGIGKAVRMIWSL